MKCASNIQTSPGSLRRRNPLLLCGMLAVLAGVSFLLAGCQSTGPQKPPSQAELAWFDVTTNQVPLVTTVTNIVTVTNDATGAVLTEPVVATVTNTVPQYDFTPNSRFQDTAATGSTIANLLAPGSGTLVGLIIGGLGSMYSAIRSRRKGQVSAGLVQAIQVARQILLQSPQGQDADREFTRWLMKHQTETGVMTEVLKLIQRNVNNNDAQAIAVEILELIHREEAEADTGA